MLFMLMYVKYRVESTHYVADIKTHNVKYCSLKELMPLQRIENTELINRNNRLKKGNRIVTLTFVSRCTNLARHNGITQETNFNRFKIKSIK